MEFGLVYFCPSEREKNPRWMFEERTACKFSVCGDDADDDGEDHEHKGDDNDELKYSDDDNRW